MLGRCLTVNGFMRRSGELTGQAAAIRLWSIFERFVQNFLRIRFTTILIQFGGVVISGMAKKGRA